MNEFSICLKNGLSFEFESDMRTSKEAFQWLENHGENIITINVKEKIKWREFEKFIFKEVSFLKSMVCYVEKIKKEGEV